MKIYLDNCCFNRPFDDQKQLRIKLETEAKLDIQERIIQGKLELAWSYILDFENEANLFEQRKLAISDWKAHACVDTDWTNEILETAERLERMGVRNKDALHLACAIVMECDYLLTTDDQFVKKTSGVTEIKVADPVSFIREDIE
ncbi:MAG: PIN domain protein [Deltaproteobacteria bacterium]|nr:PIN domain protein [Deltaproteobacteria bacterium]